MRLFAVSLVGIVALASCDASVRRAPGTPRSPGTRTSTPADASVTHDSGGAVIDVGFGPPADSGHSSALDSGASTPTDTGSMTPQDSGPMTPPDSGVPPGPVCGDRTCEPGREDCNSCEVDCGACAPCSISMCRGPRVVIFHGRGGVGPEGAWGYVTHDETITELTSAGLSVAHESTWPSSLDDVRLMLLPLPGFMSGSNYSAGEVSAMLDMVRDGGLVVIEGDNGPTLNPAVANDLLQQLGATMRIGGGSSVSVDTNHPLASGVQRVGVLASGAIDVGNATCFVPLGGGCAAAAMSVGSGYVVVLSDSQILDSYDNRTNGGDHNRRLLLNLARLP